MSLRGANYCRQSVTREGSESLERQEKSNNETAARLGIEITHTLIEPPSTSGFKGFGKDRPRFRELIDHFERGEIDCVVVYKNDRLSRGGGVGLAPIVEAAERRGLNPDRLVAADGAWVREFEVNLRAAMDREESKKTSERMLAVRRAEAEAGKPRRGSRRPYGYEDDAVTLNEHEADVLRQAVKAVIAGDSLRQVCDSLNSEGEVTSTGAPWSTTTLSRALRSQRNRGQREHKGKVIGPAAWPAIIDPGLIAELDEALSASTAAGPRSYFLSGLLYCSLCGARMWSYKRAGGVRAYGCRKVAGRPGCGRQSINAAHLEGFARTVVTTVLAHPIIQDRIEQFVSNLTSTDIAAIRLDIEAKRERLLDLAADGLLTKGQLKDRLAKLDDELRRAAQSGRRKVVIPKTLPEVEAWFDRSSVKTKAELFQRAFEYIEIRPSKRPRGSRGFDPDRLLFHGQDAPVLRKIGPRALTGMIA